MNDKSMFNFNKVRIERKQIKMQLLCFNNKGIEKMDSNKEEYE